jgi:hypothetical protein
MIHPDYPLLLSSFIAAVWKVSGSTAPWIPALTSLLFFALIVVTLIAALALLRTTSAALLSGFVLLVATSLLFMATMQYADLPLAFYILAAAQCCFSLAASLAA